ncbi:MAG TPA: dihydropteroate synthase [Steroidobacteraceae bacterium]|nr:dihydropteroate synthase [Steroidobacteraceae bacterium]
MHLNCGQRTLDLARPVVMGVLNVTPDSFSDGGRYFDRDAAVARGLRMAEEGAAIIDVGGESTRPGAAAVSAAEELDRVVPVIERLAAASAVVLSVDTSKPEVMRAAVAAGAGMVNDVRALAVPGAREAVAQGGPAVCLMHMQGEPATMQADPRYGAVVAEVRGFLAARAAECERSGIERGRICLDPGIGFGKRARHNLELLSHLPLLAELGYPLLVGVSRKSLIGIITGRPPAGRLAGSLALAALSAAGGAAIVRAHDVAETVDAVRIAAALAHPGDLGER